MIWALGRKVLAMMDITKKWTGRRQDWSLIHAQLSIYFAGRMPEYWKTATREGNANTRAIAKPIRDGQRALVRVWREGWWRDMPGRMLWTTSLP